MTENELFAGEEKAYIESRNKLIEKLKKIASPQNHDKLADLYKNAWVNAQQLFSLNSSRSMDKQLSLPVGGSFDNCLKEVCKEADFSGPMIDDFSKKLEFYEKHEELETKLMNIKNAANKEEKTKHLDILGDKLKEVATDKEEALQTLREYYPHRSFSIDLFTQRDKYDSIKNNITPQNSLQILSENKDYIKHFVGLDKFKKEILEKAKTQGLNINEKTIDRFISKSVGTYKKPNSLLGKVADKVKIAAHNITANKKTKELKKSWRESLKKGKTIKTGQNVI